MYYGPEILKDAGIGGDDPRKVLIRSIPLGAINFGGTIVALLFTDKMGRRFIMLRMLPLISLCMLGLASGMYMIYFKDM